MGIFSFGKSKEEPHRTGPASGRAQEDLLSDEKREMLRGVEELSQTSVKEVMIPRIDVDFISLDTPAEELLTRIAESGHSRFPVYSESIDNVVGVLYVKDLIQVFAHRKDVELGRIMRKAYFVPESKRIDSLLREFKRRHIHIAMAIDEYGGISGIVCMEDIIEEIVGDIQDEFDNEREDIVALSDTVWICDARVNLDDLNETIKSRFPSEDFDTLGGFVFDLFGRIPVKFEKISWNGYDFIIQDMEGHRINVIKVIYHPEAQNEE